MSIKASKCNWRNDPYPLNLIPVRPLEQIVPIPELIRKFPKTRYYGSKRKLLTWMYSKLKPLQFNTALDLFGGTASVSQLFWAMKKFVTYHDAFKFNTEIAATLLDEYVALSRSEIQSFLTSIEPKEGMIFRNFKNIFYRSAENAWLDGYMTSILNSKQSADIDYLLRYLVYQACLKKRPFNLFHRANLNLRTRSAVKRTFGNYVTWEKSFESHILDTFDELVASKTKLYVSTDVLPHGEAMDVPAGFFDLVYLDPPYVNKIDSYNRDNYWRKYHFLEGLANYHEWEKLVDLNSNIRLPPVPRQFLRWSSQTHFKKSLFELVKKHKGSIVVLSYVAQAYPSDIELKELFESHFSEIQIHSVEHAHALSSTKKRELLYIGLPK